jgi:SAM-dependent methyltransferase
MSETKPKELLAQASRDMAGAFSARLCAIGVELGIFQDLDRNGRSTSEQIATRIGLNERYLREWLHGIVLSGYVEFDKTTREAWLSAQQAQVLVDEGGRFAQYGAFKLLNSALLPYDKLLAAFRGGGGIGFEDYPPALWEALDHTGCSRYRHFLINDWLPHVPSLVKKLSHGASFADFGCGTGRSTVELAKRFPSSNFVGYDAFLPNIDKADENARSAGAGGNITFKHWNIGEGSPGKYDVVACFDLIHDLPDPELGLRVIQESMNQGGLFLLMDIEAEDDPVDNDGPFGVFKLGISLHFCMTTSMWQGGQGLGTAGLPETVLRELSQKAGFSKVSKLDIHHPLNSLYLIE